MSHIFLHTSLIAKQEYRNEVKKLAHDKGMKVALRHMDQYVEEDENFGDFAPYDVSPERFLNLLRNASMSARILSTGQHFLFLMKSSLWYLIDMLKIPAFQKILVLIPCVNFGLESRRYKMEWTYQTL